MHDLVIDYEVSFDNGMGGFSTHDEGEALRRALVSGVNGLGATVLDPIGERWRIEVDARLRDPDRRHQVIVHFLGLHVEGADWDQRRYMRPRLEI